MAGKPNILFILVDQMRMPPDQANLTPALRQLNQVLSFDPELEPDNPFLPFFPAFRRLRRHAIRLANHHIAAAACVPSRASLFTGQYPSRHLVTQTAGMFKQTNDPGFPWLPSNQVPTVGDWFRSAGYSTHFIGRHDFTASPAPSLEDWGFSDWVASWPSSQGGGPGNLGVFRDIGFVDVANTFFNRKALGTQTTITNVYNNTNATNAQTPWMAVAGFVNPHDITGWPLPWLGGVQTLPATVDDDDVFAQIGQLLAQPATIPQQGERSAPPAGGTYCVQLNPQGFPQDNAVLAPSWQSDLTTKPSCQLEASYKISQGFLAAYPSQLWQIAPLPYKSTPRPQEWLLSHLQVYIYFQYLVNLQIDRMLANLEINGLLDNTIVVFTSDHGEMGGAHGGQIEKWHNAYRESIHVPCVVSSSLLNPDEHQMADLSQVTSHIDLVPTLLGLAGYHKPEQSLLQSLILGHTVYELPGRDLSFAIQAAGEGANPGQQAGQSTEATREVDPMEGVLFVTQDDITLPTDRNNLPATFTAFLSIVKDAISQGKQDTCEGPIVQPNHVYAWCEREWKLARYIDGRRSNGTPTPDGEPYACDQWELYCLAEDPAEEINLVSWCDGQPVPQPDRIPASWNLSPEQLQSELERLRRALAAGMQRVGYAPNGGPANTMPLSSRDQLNRHNFNAP